MLALYVFFRFDDNNIEEKQLRTKKEEDSSKWLDSCKSSNKYNFHYVQALLSEYVSVFQIDVTLHTGVLVIPCGI